MRLTKRKLRQLIKEEVASLRERKYGRYSHKYIEYSDLPRNVLDGLRTLHIHERMLSEIMREPTMSGPDVYVLAIENSTYTIIPEDIVKAKQHGLEYAKFYPNDGILEFRFFGGE